MGTFLNRSYKILIALIIVTGFVHLADVRPAQAIINQNRLSVPMIAQEQTKWCWATAVKSIIQYVKGTAASQCTLVSRIFPNCPNNEGTATNMMTVLQQDGLSSVFVNQYLAFSVVKTKINNNRPIIAVIAYSQHNHAVVVRGYYEDTGVGSQKVNYMDPSDGGYYTMDYETFRFSTYQKWIQSVYDIQ